MFNEYKQGRTPNPDVLCNREIKFDVFLKAAEDIGASYIATGHYCRKTKNDNGSYSLLSGLDKNKDQSYFLCQVSQEQLSKALFPIGGLEKSEVRRIATEIGLVTADKKDSQGLCFVGKISLPTFLQQQLKPKQGSIIEISENLEIFEKYNSITPSIENVEELAEPFIFKIDQGKEVQQHQGAHYYTIGQRKGLHIGGRPEPSFIIGIDTEENVVYSGQKETHPGLNKFALQLENESFNWIQPKYQFDLKKGLSADFRIRYRQPLQKGILIEKNSNFYILFESKQKGITPGQFAAWYHNNELIGSAIIKY
jgi:tRNA-specific 2-thiouridylase